MKETITDSPESKPLLENARLISPAEQQPAPVSPGRQQRIVLVVCVSAVVLALALTWWFSTGSNTQNDASAARDTVVRRVDFYKRLRVQGTVEAVSYQPIAAPRLSGPGSGTLIITKLTTSGTNVKKGDLLVEFDRQAQIKNALDRQAGYVGFVQKVNKKRAGEAAPEAVGM